MKIDIETLKKTKGIGNRTLERIIEQHKKDNNIKTFISKYNKEEGLDLTKKFNLINGDMIKELNRLPDKSVDMILTDLPYGTTANYWDSVIPFEILWKHYNRIIKDDGNIVLFSQGLFTANLIKSNENDFRYKLVWNKILSSGFLDANRRPLPKHEDIVVFYKKRGCYNPQFTKGKPNNPKGTKFLEKNTTNNNYGKFTQKENNKTLGDKKYPTSIIEISKPHPSINKHPTQKPVQLLEYLIKTYSNESDLILDSTMGSGSTGVAALNTNRRFVGIELNEQYFKIAEERILNRNEDRY